MRHQFQGVTNILRFNWHFYALAVVGAAVGLLLASWLGGWWLVIGVCLVFAVLATTIVSLLVSWYVYDQSNLYTLDWLGEQGTPREIVNIHAGFDETSVFLAQRFPTANLQVFDFYDPELHTEISIKRARKAYAAFPGTVAISTSEVPLPENSVDLIFLLLSAHEIREETERSRFFSVLRMALKPGGKIIVAEHLRDRANLLAYSLGAFHFLPREEWYHTFTMASFNLVEEQKINPFITAFMLTKNVDPS